MQLEQLDRLADGDTRIQDVVRMAALTMRRLEQAGRDYERGYSAHAVDGARLAIARTAFDAIAAASTAPCAPVAVAMNMLEPIKSYGVRRDAAYGLMESLAAAGERSRPPDPFPRACAGLARAELAEPQQVLAFLNRCSEAADASTFATVVLDEVARIKALPPQNHPLFAPDACNALVGAAVVRARASFQHDATTAELLDRRDREAALPGADPIALDYLTLRAIAARGPVPFTGSAAALAASARARMAVPRRERYTQERQALTLGVAALEEIRAGAISPEDRAKSASLLEIIRDVNDVERPSAHPLLRVTASFDVTRLLVDTGLARITEASSLPRSQWISRVALEAMKGAGTIVIKREIGLSCLRHLARDTGLPAIVAGVALDAVSDKHDDAHANSVRDALYAEALQSIERALEFAASGKTEADSFLQSVAHVSGQPREACLPGDEAAAAIAACRSNLERDRALRASAEVTCASLRADADAARASLERLATSLADLEKPMDAASRRQVKLGAMLTGAGVAAACVVSSMPVLGAAGCVCAIAGAAMAALPWLEREDVRPQGNRLATQRCAIEFRLQDLKRQLRTAETELALANDAIERNEKLLGFLSMTSQTPPPGTVEQREASVRIGSVMVARRVVPTGTPDFGGQAHPLR